MYTMKKIFDFIMTAGLVCACSQPVVLSSGDEYVLDRWTLNQEGTDVCYDVEVPSTVAGALCEEGVLSADTSIISAQTTDGTCFVNFTSSFAGRNSGDEKKERLAIYSIVNSLTELKTVQNVQFLVEGKKLSEFGTISISDSFFRNEKIIENNKIEY